MTRGYLTLFPTLIQVSKLPIKNRKFNQQILQECYSFKELDVGGHKWSRENYFAGYTSYGSLADLPQRSPTFAELKLQLDRLVLQFAKQLDMDLGDKKLVMSSCWINIMGLGCHHSFHLHPLSTISGTYYVQIPKDSGAIKFEDPRLPMMMASPPRKSRAKQENQRFIEVSPQECEVVLFESWLKHEVPTNRSNADRISISFNYDWI
jgi:uncharacterized protein (TIGR02466 family)